VADKLFELYFLVGVKGLSAFTAAMTAAKEHVEGSTRRRRPARRCASTARISA
jgi:hypothetical protein